MNKKPTTQETTPKPAKTANTYLGITRYGSNDIGLYLLKDGKEIEIARDTYAIIQAKLSNELYRICYLEI